VAELLAHHFDQAGDRPRARRYALEAARRDLARLAVDQAHSLATRAAELADDGRERAAALIVIGEVAYQRANGDDAYRAWREAIGLLESDPLADRRELAGVCGRLALLITRAPGLMPQTIATPDETRHYLEVGFAAAGERNRWRWSSCCWRGRLGLRFPEPPPTELTMERMRAAGTRAVGIAERLDRPELLSIALDVQHISHECETTCRRWRTGGAPHAAGRPHPGADRPRRHLLHVGSGRLEQAATGTRSGSRWTAWPG